MDEKELKEIAIFLYVMREHVSWRDCRIVCEGKGVYVTDHNNIDNNHRSIVVANAAINKMIKG